MDLDLTISVTDILLAGFSLVISATAKYKNNIILNLTTHVHDVRWN